MGIYLNTETQEYPRYDGDLEAIGWDVGSPLPQNWVEVHPTLIPSTTETQTVIGQPPKQNDLGVWEMQWVVRDLTQEELDSIKISNIRQKVFRGEPITSEEAQLLTK